MGCSNSKQHAIFMCVPGRDMKKVQSCDELTDQQKKTRVEWIISELQDAEILPYNYVYDRDRLVIGDSEEVRLQFTYDL